MWPWRRRFRYAQTVRLTGDILASVKPWHLGVVIVDKGDFEILVCYHGDDFYWLSRDVLKAA